MHDLNANSSWSYNVASKGAYIMSNTGYGWVLIAVGTRSDSSDYGFAEVSWATNEIRKHTASSVPSAVVTIKE